MITQTGLVRPPPLRGYQLETFCKMKFRLVSCPSAAKISAHYVLFRATKVIQISLIRFKQLFIEQNSFWQLFRIWTIRRWKYGAWPRGKLRF